MQVVDPCRKDTIQDGQPTSGTYHLMSDKSISLEDCATQVAAESDEYNAVSVQKYLHSGDPDDPELDCYGWKGSNGGVAHHNGYRLETCMLQNGYEVDSRKIDSNYKIAPEYLKCNDVTSGDYLPVSTEAECRKACATFKNSIFYKAWWNNIPIL